MTTSATATELAIAALEWVSRELALSDAELGGGLGVDRKNIYRWRMREHAPMPEHLIALGKLATLKTQLERTFRTPDLAKRWFRQPQAALNGRTPIVALRDGKIDSVIALLAASTPTVAVP